MIAAMKRHTVAGCRESVEKSIALAGNNTEVAKYLRINWLPDEKLKKFGLSSRNHSMALMQTHSTNPIESYHSHIKRQIKTKMTFLAALKCIFEVNLLKKRAIDKMKINTKGKRLTLLENYEEFHPFMKLDICFQKLICEQIMKGQQLTEDLDIIEVLPQEYYCHCKFFKNYLLPCEHIFASFFENILDFNEDDIRDVFGAHFSNDSGIELYESWGQVTVQITEEDREEALIQSSVHQSIGYLNETATEAYYHLLNRPDELLELKEVLKDAADAIRNSFK